MDSFYLFIQSPKSNRLTIYCEQISADAWLTESVYSISWLPHRAIYFNCGVHLRVHNHLTVQYYCAQLVSYQTARVCRIATAEWCTGSGWHYIVDSIVAPSLYWQTEQSYSFELWAESCRAREDQRWDQRCVKSWKLRSTLHNVRDVSLLTRCVQNFCFLENAAFGHARRDYLRGFCPSSGTEFYLMSIEVSNCKVIFFVVIFNQSDMSSSSSLYWRTMSSHKTD